MSEQNTTIVADGLARLISQFDGSARFRDLVASYLLQVQEFEDAAFPLLTERNIDVATGHRLDGFGQILGVLRGARTDDLYRQALKAELAVLVSEGGTDELLNIIRLIYPPGFITTVQYEVMEYFPKEIIFRPINVNTSPSDAAIITAALRRAAPAATNVQFIWGNFGLDDILYTLSSQATVLETEAARGLANDAQSTGGRMAQAL